MGRRREGMPEARGVASPADPEPHTPDPVSADVPVAAEVPPLPPPRRRARRQCPMAPRELGSSRREDLI